MRGQWRHRSAGKVRASARFAVSPGSVDVHDGHCRGAVATGGDGLRKLKQGHQCALAGFGGLGVRDVDIGLGAGQAGMAQGHLHHCQIRIARD